MKDTVVLIPLSAPSESLPTYIASFTDEGYRVLLVCDGCEPDNISALGRGCTVVRYAVKQGIGRAIKFGINYILEKMPDCRAAVIADVERVYDAADVKLCVAQALEHTDKLILGARQMSKRLTFKARFVNSAMRFLLKLLCGISVTDTRTRLRAFSRKLMAELISIRGENDDFLLNMLLYAKRKQIPIESVAVATEYTPPQKRPFIQGLGEIARIFLVFIKFMMTSLSSFVVDWLAFTLFIWVFKDLVPNPPQYYILYSTVLSRVISACLNFSLNKFAVFRKEGKPVKTFLKYATLCVVQLLVSSTLVTLVYDSLFAGAVSESIIKIFVDAALFFVSFQIQREWVFK